MYSAIRHLSKSEVTPCSTSAKTILACDNGNLLTGNFHQIESTTSGLSYVSVRQGTPFFIIYLRIPKNIS